MSVYTIRNAPPGILVLRTGVLVFKPGSPEGHPRMERSSDPQCYVLAGGTPIAENWYDMDCMDVTDECMTIICLGPRISFRVLDETTLLGRTNFNSFTEGSSSLLSDGETSGDQTNNSSVARPTETRP